MYINFNLLGLFSNSNENKRGGFLFGHWLWLEGVPLIGGGVTSLQTFMLWTPMTGGLRERACLGSMSGWTTTPHVPRRRLPYGPPNQSFTVESRGVAADWNTKPPIHSVTTKVIFGPIDNSDYYLFHKIVSLTMLNLFFFRSIIPPISPPPNLPHIF